MIENLKNASEFSQGLFVMLSGLAGVFLVLIIFFFLIKGLIKAFPEDKETKNDNGDKGKVIV